MTALSLGLSAERVDRRLATSFSGVGLIRGEYVCRKLHQYLTVPAAQRWLTDYLRHVADVFAPKPVWYRTTDLEAREVSVLEGCDEDLVDRVAMLGTRGIRRARRLPDAFRSELGAVRAAAVQHPNLGVLFPYISDPDELRWAVGEARAAGLGARLGCMAETPAAVVQLDELLECGVQRVLIGCNDLGSLTMGVDRGSTRYAPVPGGLVRMIERARASTARHGVELGIAGYLTPAHIDVARACGVDDVVIHYCDAPGLLGPEFADLPELDSLASIKQWTRRALAARRPPDPRGPADRVERRRWPREQVGVDATRPPASNGD